MLLQGTVDLKLLWAFWTDKKRDVGGGGRRGWGGKTSTASDAKITCVTFASISPFCWSPLHLSPGLIFIIYIYFFLIFFFYSWQTEQDEGSVYLDGWRWNAVLKEEVVKLKFQNGAYLFVRLSTLSCLCPTLPLYLNHTSNNFFFFFFKERGKGERQHFGAFLLLAEF